VRLAVLVRGDDCVERSAGQVGPPAPLLGGDTVASGGGPQVTQERRSGTDLVGGHLRAASGPFVSELLDDRACCDGIS